MIAPKPTMAPERPGSWLAALVAIIALAALLLERSEILKVVPAHFRPEVLFGILVLAVILGGVAIRSFVARIFYEFRNTPLRAWRPVANWVLYIILGLGVLSALQINLTGLLAAGAVLGVVLGVAAQTSLASVFAGLVLLLARPFAVGSWVHLRTYLFAGYDYSGVVTHIGVVYTTMDLGGRLVRLPNTAVLAGALTVTHMPIQLDIELQLKGQASLKELHQRLRDRLQLGAGETVLLRPVRLTTEGEGQLTCQLQIRAHKLIDMAEVSRALLECEHPEPGGFALPGSIERSA